jgi:hypothetical protein
LEYPDIRPAGYPAKTISGASLSSVQTINSTSFKFKKCLHVLIKTQFTTPVGMGAGEKTVL